jgi:hypothetical protein
MSVAATREQRPAVVLAEVRAPAAKHRHWPFALAAVFVVATLYHWLQSRGHVTPAIFTDELLFSELARSFAAGEGFTVRDQPFFFPAFIPALLQAPVWLVGSTPLAYELAKALNTVLMCSAALPAYWLARQVVRPPYALIVAVATVAGGAMLYHAYLTSEAAAYPVFLLALAVCVRALAAPSPRLDVIAVAVLALAVLTRAQFVVLPLAFVLAILLTGRPLRRHASALTLLIGAAVTAVVVGTSLLGFYAGARELDYSLGEALRWSGWTAALLPFAAGVLVVPGALVGLTLGLFRPRTPAERGFAVLFALLAVLVPLQAGLIASGDTGRPLERYAYYLVPLFFVAFLSLAERGGAGKRLSLGVALAVGGVALVVPFPSLALDPFSFDSPTLSAVAALGRVASPGDAAVLFAAGGMAAAVAAAALRRRPGLLAALSVLVAFLIGLAAYSGDRRMTTRTLDALAPAQPDWLERSGIQEADMLALEGGSLHAGWVLESWNRNVGRTLHLGDLPTDPLPNLPLGLLPDGTLATVDRRPVRSEYLVVDHSGTQVALDAELVAEPRPDLHLYRPGGVLRVRSVAFGVHSDGWARSVVRYAAFRSRGAKGHYVVTLALPAGRLARRVELECGPVRRRITLEPGTSQTVRIASSGYPLWQLAIRADRADFVGAGSHRPRLVAARITRLEFVEDKRSRNR